MHFPAKGMHSPAIPRGNGTAWPEIDRAFDRLLAAFWSHPRPFWKELSFNALEEILFRVSGLGEGSAQGRMDPPIGRVLDYLAAHITEPFDLGEVAKKNGISTSSLSHRFKAATGESPRRFFERCRLELARDLLLHSSLGVAEVSVRSGFSSPFYFSRRYTAHFGENPGVTRETGGKSG